MKNNLVVLTGAGMSAESGLSTFRDSNGLWNNYNITEVASIEGWHNNPELVLEFYNKRRAELKVYNPNKGHHILKELEEIFDVTIITQNVDNFHERAGSSHIIHLHGELTQMKSIKNENLTYPIDGDIRWGDKAEDGAQLRPDIVWFGEAVPKMQEAIKICEGADIFLIIGTSLQVYPAASLIDFAPKNSIVFLIDPNPIETPLRKNITFIQKGASEGLEDFKNIISI